MDIDKKVEIYEDMVAVCYFIFFVGFGITIWIFSSVPEDSGNGGAFIAMFGVLAFILTAPALFILGISTFIFGLFIRGKFPKQFYYSRLAPLLMAFSPFALQLKDYLHDNLGII